MAHENKKDDEKRRSPARVSFFLVEAHKCLTSIAVLTEHGKTSLLYTFQQTMQANRDINLCDKHQWTFFVVRNERRL